VYRHFPRIIEEKHSDGSDFSFSKILRRAIKNVFVRYEVSAKQ